MTAVLPDGWETWTHETWTRFTTGIRNHPTLNADQKVDILHTARAARGLVTWPTPSALAADLFPGYQPARHLELIDRAFQDASEGKADRILICVPPQTGKSTTASEAGPLWWLHGHPRQRVVVASYAAELAEKRGRRVRNTIVEHSARLGLQLASDSKAASRWDLRSGGGMLCMGVGGGLTGNPADFAVIDDPHKDRAEANSRLIRESVWDWWTSTLLTRLQPGGVAVLILTRWHEDDLAARVLATEGSETEGGRWRTIILPALAEAADDPLGRQPGDPLTHPKLPHADRVTLLDFWAAKRHEVGAREWPALYQQRPAPPEGAVWKWGDINSSRIRPEEMPTLSKRVVAVDPSGTAHQGSDECGIVVCGRDQKGHGYVLDDRSRIASPAEWGRIVCQAAVDWECVEIVAEQNQGYEMVQDVIKNAWKALQASDRRAARLLQPRVQKAHSRIGKVLRAEPVAAIYERLEVHHVGDTLDRLEDQMCTWVGDGDSPDRVDALVHGMTFLLKGQSGPARSRSVADQVLPSTGLRR